MRRSMGLLLAVLVVGPLAACGSGDSAERAVSTTTTSISVERAFDAAPLRQAVGAPIAADADAIWYSDFRRLARFDGSTGRWATVALPAEAGHVDGLSIAADGRGGLSAVVAICSATCEEGVPRSMEAWSVSSTLVFTQPTKAASVATTSDSAFASVVSDGPDPAFLVHDGTRSTLVAWDGDRVEVTSVDRPLAVLCRLADEFIGVAEDPTTGALAAPRVLVQGPLLAGLQPLPVNEAQQGLLDAPESTVGCLPTGGLALVGPAEAWEYRDRAWQVVRSDVGTSLQHQLPQGLPVRVDGDIWQAGTVANLVRDRDGWHLAPDSPRPSGYLVIDRMLIRYPSAAPTPGDPGQQGAPTDGVPTGRSGG